jgi:cell division septum initiation protein DivIVA
MSDLATRMRSTTSEIGRCQGSTDGATRRVVSSVTSDARAALTQIQGEMSQLRSSVAGSLATANATNWTGSNAQVFRSSAADFDAAMQRAEAATADAFTQFQASIQQMADALETYQASFSAALTKAQASTTSMENAVVAQRNHLDETMNQGMSIS